MCVYANLRLYHSCKYFYTLAVRRWAARGFTLTSARARFCVSAGPSGPPSVLLATSSTLSHSSHRHPLTQLPQSTCSAYELTGPDPMGASFTSHSTTLIYSFFTLPISSFLKLLKTGSFSTSRFHGALPCTCNIFRLL